MAPCSALRSCFVFKNDALMNILLQVFRIIVVLDINRTVESQFHQVYKLKRFGINKRKQGVDSRIVDIQAKEVTRQQQKETLIRFEFDTTTTTTTYRKMDVEDSTVKLVSIASIKE